MLSRATGLPAPGVSISGTQNVATSTHTSCPYDALVIEERDGTTGRPQDAVGVTYIVFLQYLLCSALRNNLD